MIQGIGLHTIVLNKVLTAFMYKVHPCLVCFCFWLTFIMSFQVRDSMLLDIDPPPVPANHKDVLIGMAFSTNITNQKVRAIRESLRDSCMRHQSSVCTFLSLSHGDDVSYFQRTVDLYQRSKYVCHG